MTGGIIVSIELLFFCAAFMIAGNTAEYVNCELEKVAKRIVSGNE